MPELPDVVVYIEALGERVLGRRLERLRLRSPFLLRTVQPPLRDAEGRAVIALRRVGKRIALGLEGGLYLVIHLMISGRLRWKAAGAGIPGRIGLAAFDFDAGTLLLTEAGSKKRAALHLVAGDEALTGLDRGGIEVLDAGRPAFRDALARESHTLKRALTDPRLFSGIGNAYSDEILHRAGLSPLQTTRRLSEDEVTRLFEATRAVLVEWTDRLRRERGDRLPENVTAFLRQLLRQEPELLDRLVGRQTRHHRLDAAAVEIEHTRITEQVLHPRVRYLLVLRVRLDHGHVRDDQGRDEAASIADEDRLRD